ncbi:hypothetical protein ACTHHL_00450 [Aeribacillus composti]|uniref:hypothetical protein n=1 Tax=Aeribacillus TaxID=1055323 RepID=UPI0030F61822
MSSYIISFLKSFLPVKTIKILKQQHLYNNLNMYRLECIIDSTLEELKLKNYLSGKKISELNEIDLDYFLAHINSLVEKTKAIQLTVVFLSLFFTFLVNFMVTLLEPPVDKAEIFLIFSIAIFITAPYLEKNYKSTIANFTFLKEILTIYKNNKFK